MLDTLGDRGTLELKDIIKERRKRSEIVTTVLGISRSWLIFEMMIVVALQTD